MREQFFQNKSLITVLLPVEGDSTYVIPKIEKKEIISLINFFEKKPFYLHPLEFKKLLRLGNKIMSNMSYFYDELNISPKLFSILIDISTASCVDNLLNIYRNLKEEDDKYLLDKIFSLTNELSSYDGVLTLLLHRICDKDEVLKVRILCLQALTFRKSEKIIQTLVNWCINADNVYLCKKVLKSLKILCSTNTLYHSILIYIFSYTPDPEIQLLVYNELQREKSTTLNLYLKEQLIDLPFNEIFERFLTIVPINESIIELIETLFIKKDLIMIYFNAISKLLEEEDINKEQLKNLINSLKKYYEQKDQEVIYCKEKIKELENQLKDLSEINNILSKKEKEQQQMYDIIKNQQTRIIEQLKQLGSLRRMLEKLI